MVSAKWHNKQLYIFTLSGLLHSCQLYWIGRALSSKILQRQHQRAFLWSFFQNIPKGLDALAMLGSPIGRPRNRGSEQRAAFSEYSQRLRWFGIWLLTSDYAMAHGPSNWWSTYRGSEQWGCHERLYWPLPSFLSPHWPLPASTVSKRKGGFKCSDEYPFPIIHPP